MKNSNGAGQTHGFVELLENAFAHPESFSSKIIPEVQANPDANFPLLIRTFEIPNVVAKNLVADLFRTALRDAGCPFMLHELSSKNSERFFWASTILTDNQVVEAVPGLIQALSAASTPIVLAALKALTRFECPDAREAILNFFLSATDEVQISSSIRIISPISAWLLPRMVEQFPRLEESRKAWVLKFLAETGSEQAMGIFADSFAKDPFAFGVFCIKGLGKIGSGPAVQALISQLANPEWFLRKKVVEALGQARVPEAIPALIRALVDSSVQVRAAAIQSLTQVGKLGPKVIIESMAKADHNQKVGLVRAMGQIKEPSFLKPLIDALQDRSLLFFTLDALGDLGLPEAVEALRPFLEDPEWFNRLNALEALAKLPNQNLHDWAQSCLEDPSDMVRNAAARIMAQTNQAGS